MVSTIVRKSAEFSISIHFIMISRGNTVWTSYPTPQPRTLSQQRHPHLCTLQNIMSWPYTMRHSAMSMSVS
ncbi:hypothetical protein XF_0219 [Xylella fastidiosa 9a5c]|uniref:Uncharacterized protein n=1 Tax=Xylella fastidiosa (strain 9a5c) TaxID=160492 RepID=Q9PGS9_XYLFA|nr:hypothetical protein XF_0219 [Xylella fastidiosa 9a5c]